MSRTYAELPGLMTVMTGDEKHGPSATSTLDVLWVLYDRVLRVSPDRLDDPGRDRFLLSKGHGPAERGYRVSAAGVAEQCVEGHAGGEAGGERPTAGARHAGRPRHRAAAGARHQAIVPGA